MSDLPWNTEDADLGLVQRVLKNDKYCYLGLFYLHFCDFFECLAVWEEMVTGVHPFCRGEIAHRENHSRACRQADTDMHCPRRYFEDVNQAFVHVVRQFWCLVSLTLPDSAQIFDTSFMVTGSWDESDLVRPFVYYPPNSSLEVWKERLKICGMLSSRSGAFQINGKDVNAVSHATYSHVLRNNELWCSTLHEVGWHLQEIMREGLEIYEPEGGLSKMCTVTVIISITRPIGASLSHTTTCCPPSTRRCC